ncbi:13124_t:CDS:2, partial [Acaulospora morrowiae]
YDRFLKFVCAIDEFNSVKAKNLITHLYKNLRIYYKTTYDKTETTQSEYVFLFLINMAETGLIFTCLLEVIIYIVENLIQLYLVLKTNQKHKYDEIDSKFANKPTILNLAKEFEPLEKSAERILDQIV